MIPINTQLPIAVGFVDSRQGGRAENQDTCGYADTPLGLLVVVCDGMGGGPSGKAASSTATDVIIQTVRSGKLSDSPLTVLQQAIKMANQALISEIQKKPALRGMGTTVTRRCGTLSDGIPRTGRSSCSTWIRPGCRISNSTSIRATPIRASNASSAHSRR